MTPWHTRSCRHLGCHGRFLSARFLALMRWSAEEKPEDRSGHQSWASWELSAPFFVPRPDDAANKQQEDLGGENSDVQAGPRIPGEPDTQSCREFDVTECVGPWVEQPGAQEQSAVEDAAKNSSDQPLMGAGDLENTHRQK